MVCPVCGSSGASAGTRDYRDKHRYDCPRCGSYEISGTAAAMLPNLLQSARDRGRLSHAIRVAPRKQGELLMVNSVNVRELHSQPLPGVDQQARNLLRWAATEAGDDRLGNVALPPLEVLASVVGAVDATGTERLLVHVAQAGLIQLPETEVLCLTPQGWKEIDRLSTGGADAQKSAAAERSDLPPRPDTTLPEPEGSRVQAQENEPEIVKAHCNTCGGTRKAHRRARYEKYETDRETDWSNTIEILECCGCEGLSMRHEFWFSEWDEFDYDPITGDEIRIPGVKTTIWPPQRTRKKPEWADELDDQPLRSVLDEVYAALDQGLFVLAAIGTRTMIDRAMTLRVSDVGGFAGKLTAMVNAGRISSTDKETLLIMTDAGSAAAHRGFAPSRETLDDVLSVVEGFLDREFIFPKRAAAVKQAVPPRSGGMP